MVGAAGFQTLNIVDTMADTIDNQSDDQIEYPVCYGPNNCTNIANNKAKQKSQPSNPNKITVLKRDHSGNDRKDQNLNSPCMICNSTKNPTH